jgi:phosphohistidine phosphatase
MPLLYLVRHAKSDWPMSVDDFDRPLAARGIADCVSASLFFSDKQIDHVEVSAAKRTLETLNLLHLRTSSTNENINIYEAHLGALLECVNSLKFETAMLVGHSPGMPSLAWYLSSNHDSAPAQRLRMKYPTLGIAVLRCDLPFADWHEGCAELVDFVVPRAEVTS